MGETEESQGSRPSGLARREFLKVAAFAPTSILSTHWAFSALNEFLEFDKLALEERKDLIERLGLADLYNERFSHYSPAKPVEVREYPFEMIGVAHSPQTLHFHQKEIMAKVKQAPFVFLEYFGTHHRQLALPQVSFNEILSPEHYNWSFYSGVGRVCAVEGKDIVVVNPQNKSTEMLEAYLAGGIPVGLTAIGLVEASEHLIAKILQKRLSRREFLKAPITAVPKWALVKILALGPSATVWASWAGLTEDLKETLIKKGIMDSNLSPEEEANFLSWYMNDWRDVQTARGVDKAMALFNGEIKQGQRAVMFQGDLHKGMIDYLRDPKLRRKRALAYPHYQAIGETTIRRYSYNTQKSQWGLAQQINY